MPAPSKPEKRELPPTIDPVWIAKAFAAVLTLALLCGYATLCLLFYQGQWQLLLHPEAEIKQTPKNLGLAFEEVRFDFAETGQPQLTGWWIPAVQKTREAPPAVRAGLLYLHGGDGNLSTALPQLASLHAAGLNIFAIDYRGYGHSATLHPSQSLMQEDAAAALTYLIQQRHFDSAHILLAGDGLGAILAANIATTQTPALILTNPTLDALDQIRRDTRSTLIPLHLLLHDRWSPETLATLATPKLILLSPAAPTPTRVADPKFLVHLPGTPQADAAAVQQSLPRFLDEYLSGALLAPR